MSIQHEDEAILLKIKRDFTSNEAVQSLLKMLAKSEEEVGKLKSELAEAQDKVEKIRNAKIMPKKQWMEEEVFEMVNKELVGLREKNKELHKQLNSWRDQYFSLYNKTVKND